MLTLKSLKKRLLIVLLNFYDKDDGFTSKEKVRNAMIFWSVWLRSASQYALKNYYIRYRFDVIYELPDAVPEDEPFEDDEPGTVKVTFNAAQLTTQIIRVRTGLGMYGTPIESFTDLLVRAMLTIRRIVRFSILMITATWDSGVTASWKQLMNGLEGFFRR